MRFDEFRIKDEEGNAINEHVYLRGKLKEKHPHLTEEQLDELAPLAALVPLAVGAGAAARAGVAALGAGARAVGTAAVQGARAVGSAVATGARALGKAAATGAKALGKSAVSGAKNLAVGAAKSAAQGTANMAANKINDIKRKQLLKKGSMLPTNKGDLKIDDVKGDEITVSDPKNAKARKVIMHKDDPAVKQGMDMMMNR